MRRGAACSHRSCRERNHRTGGQCPPYASAPRTGTVDSLLIGVIPAKAGIQWWKRWRMLSFRPWIPASAGMTLNWMHRHHHRRGRRQAGTPASARPTRLARAATKRGRMNHLAPPWRKASILRSGGVITIGGAVGKPARRRPPDPTRSARAATKRGRMNHLAPPWRKASILRSSGRQAVGKPARRHPPDRRARRAPLRRGGA